MIKQINEVQRFLKLEPDARPENPLFICDRPITGNAKEVGYMMTFAMNCPKSAVIVTPELTLNVAPEWIESHEKIADKHQGTYVLPWQRSFSQPYRMLQALQTSLETSFATFWERSRDDIAVYLLTEPNKGCKITTVERRRSLFVEAWGDVELDGLMPRSGFGKRGFGNG